MLLFAQDSESEIIILTLSELAVTSDPDFYFVFTHVSTKEEVTYTDQDESAHPERYNKFTINPSVLFAGKQIGDWHYKVYENDSEGVLLEEGKLRIVRPVDFEFDKYDSANTLKTYNG